MQPIYVSLPAGRCILFGTICVLFMPLVKKYRIDHLIQMKLHISHYFLAVVRTFFFSLTISFTFPLSLLSSSLSLYAFLSLKRED